MKHACKGRRPTGCKLKPEAGAMSVSVGEHLRKVWADEGKPYIGAGIKLGHLVQTKNDAYGDSINATGDMLRLLFKDGIKPHQYRDLGLIVRVWDKLKRIATNRDALGESPWQDIAGYGLLGMELTQRGKDGE